MILPSEFNMGAGLDLVCESQGGFSSAPTCKTIADNEIAINMDTANIGTASVFIAVVKNVINPLFETGDFTFTFELVFFRFLNLLEKCH